MAAWCIVLHSKLVNFVELSFQYKLVSKIYTSRFEFLILIADASVFCSWQLSAFCARHVLTITWLGMYLHLDVNIWPCEPLIFFLKPSCFFLSPFLFMTASCSPFSRSFALLVSVSSVFMLYQLHECIDQPLSVDTDKHWNVKTETRVMRTMHESVWSLALKPNENCWGVGKEWRICYCVWGSPCRAEMWRSILKRLNISYTTEQDRVEEVEKWIRRSDCKWKERLTDVRCVNIESGIDATL